MGYRNLRQCIDDLKRAGHLVVLDDEVDARLEAAEIHRRVFASGGPAVFYANVKGCRFPMVSNLFGTMERTRFIFRDTLDAVRKLIELKIDPGLLVRQLGRYAGSGWAALRMRPKFRSTGPVLANATSIDQLPQLVSWPGDGGAFITLPQVYTEDAERPGAAHSNLGMYRIQLSGGRYEQNREVGLHYQIHRGIGIHQTIARRRGAPFRVNIFVGGTPAMSVAAVMPLPEGMSELGFAGVLAGHRIPLIRPAAHLNTGGLPIYAEADFCITGTVAPDKLLPEGPFGDHLGYYSLAHDFPVLQVERVSHRDGAIWPFTVVGRPPQEDTMFGKLIHEITGPVIPTVVPGVRAVHAVDAAGVHPLMLAVGSERYTPFYDSGRPQELLTQANAILGQGQMSLAKYLFIAAANDAPDLDVEDIAGFFSHVLRRCDWRRDLHFQTCTTIDTLDYSGGALNEGSKVVIAAAGPPIRELPTEVLPGVSSDQVRAPRLCLPGVLAVEAPGYAQYDRAKSAEDFCRAIDGNATLARYPLVVLVDDSEFTAASLNNFLWVAFTRSNPAADIHGAGAFVHQKHWGCRCPLVIDARTKPHHASPLESDPEIASRVDALAARGGPLAKFL
jgi:4-hydroxy-3-polyprenylbenzoate decarboxylase